MPLPFRFPEPVPWGAAGCHSFVHPLQADAARGWAPTATARRPTEQSNRRGLTRGSTWVRARFYSFGVSTWPSSSASSTWERARCCVQCFKHMGACSLLRAVFQARGRVRVAACCVSSPWVRARCCVQRSKLMGACPLLLAALAAGRGALPWNADPGQGVCLAFPQPLRRSPCPLGADSCPPGYHGDVRQGSGWPDKSAKGA